MPARDRIAAVASIAAVLLLSSSLGPARLRAASPSEAANAEPSQATVAYRLVDTWTSRAPGGNLPRLENPAGIDVSVDGEIYVTDLSLGRVFRLDSQGGLIADWQTDPSVGPPHDVAASSDRVYVIGSATSAGEIRDRQGNFIRLWSPGDARGVAVGPDRRIYVSGTTVVESIRVAAVHIYDVDGNHLEVWTAEPFLRIREPFGIDVGPDGTVYLAADQAVYSFRNERVVGGFRFRAAVEGPDVVDVAADAERVFAVQRGRLAAWTIDGRLTDPPDIGLAGAAHVAVGPGGGLVVSVVDSAFTGLSYLTDRTDLSSPIEQWGVGDSSLGQLESPYRLSVDEAGNVYILDRLERIQLWSSDGVPVGQWSPMAAVDVGGGAGRGCLVDGESAKCLGQGGTVIWTESPDAAAWLSGVAGDGDTLFAVDLATQQVWSFDVATGAPGASLQLAPPGSFAGISDIAYGGGTLYLAERSSNSVRRFTADGAPLASVPIARGPARLAAAGSSLFVATLDGWIFELDSNGSIVGVLDPASTDVSDIAYDSSGRLFVADRDNNRILVYERDPGGSPLAIPPDPAKERCDVMVDKSASPGQVFVGERVTVRLDIGGGCPFGDEALDIVLILDRSGSMAGPQLAAAKTAAIAFLAELDSSKAQVAVIPFSTAAEVAQPLTGDFRTAVRSIAELTANGQTFFEEALDFASSELFGPAGRPEAGKVVVMLTDGHPTDELRGREAATRLKQSGATLYEIGLGADVNDALLSEMASAPELYFKAPTEGELSRIYTAIARRIGATKLLHQGTVIDVIPPDMSFVPGSAQPAPTSIQGRTLTWELDDVPLEGLSLSYRVIPNEPGARPTNVLASLDYVDALDTEGSSTFPVPVVNVLAITHWEAYLPALFNAECQPKRADVVLVIDTSSSMSEPAQQGSSTTKLQEAVRAARSFLDAMTFPGDQAAIVQFDSEARIVQELTGTRSALEFGLANVTSGVGTRIDLGIDTGLQALLGPKHDPAHSAVMVLLTDGRPIGGTEGAALSSAFLARQFGVELFAIGLGRDADPILMISMVGRAERYYFAPDASTLAEIYSQIAGQVLCR